MHIEKDVPVVGAYDVVVCGGGPSGFIAALAAAEGGAKTALIERYGFLGGMATIGYVEPISVFSYNGERNIGGIPWKFIERLRSIGGAFVEEPLNNVAFNPELYKLCAQRMVLEQGVDLFMNSYISGLVMNEHSINAVTFENKNGTEAITGKVFIDATGDGDLAHMAGLPMQDWGDVPLQPSSTYFILSGVDTDAPLVRNAMHHNKQGVNCQCEPIREKLLALSNKMSIPSFGGPWFCTTLNKGNIAMNITRASANACDNRNFTKAECSLREDCFTFASILRNYFPEFKDCFISSIAPQMGTRESRHIRGIHIVTGEEYLHAFHYEDSVSRSSHPIDIHSGQSAKQDVFFLKKAAYVPYRALIANDFPNIIIAGRTVSADKTAFASLRVQASCMGMGQAAGFAAAQSSLHHVAVQDIDVKCLVDTLKREGAKLD